MTCQSTAEDNRSINTPDNPDNAGIDATATDSTGSDIGHGNTEAAVKTNNEYSGATTDTEIPPTNHGGSTNSGIKAVFFDIDGTLTSFATHDIPESTVRALRELKDRGILIFLCTGRAVKHIDVVLRMLPVTFDGIVAMNGQYCVDDHGVLDAHPLDNDDVATITAWLDRHPDVTASYSEADYVYLNRLTDMVARSQKRLGKTAPQRFVDDPHTRIHTHNTFQISPFITLEQEKELVGLCHNTTGVRWHPDFTDLIPSDGGKPRGMECFLQHYGIAREHAMAFGDGGNDIAMLRYAGIGVAMGNAADNVKAAADIVTDDVDHNGVFNALRHCGVI